MNKNGQIATEIINKMIENLDKNIYNDYKDNKKIFIDIVDDWIKPTLDRVIENYSDYAYTQSFKVKAKKKINNIRNKLSKWRAERHLTIESQEKNLLANILEELTELSRAKDDLEKIDAYCDIIVFCMNTIDSKEYIDIINYDINTDIKVFAETIINQINKNQIDSTINDCLMAIEQLGYDKYLCMQETIKEISSRTGHYDESIGKFVKDLGFYTLSECQETYPNYKVTEEANRFKLNLGDEIQYQPKWYKANYSKCKLAK